MNTQISEIRALLERYYAGETSPAENKRLYALIDSATDLPDDIAADCMMLKAMRESCPEVPDTLLQRITDAVEEAAKPKRRQYFTPRIFTRIAAGAAACIAALAIIMQFLPSGPINSQHPAELAQADTHAADTMPADTHTTAATPAPPATEPAKNEKAAPSPAKQPRKKRARIITDPNEILMLAQSTMAEVDAGLAQTEMLMAEALDCIEQSENNINTIIQ